VDVVVPGCPPSPTQILAGILAALSDPRRNGMSRASHWTGRRP
jgi:Ni,Fe-hydrogenase III small subunit